MGYELGFATKDYNENDPNWNDNIIWFWCGWENTLLFEALSLLSKEGFTQACSDIECHIPTKNLIFIKNIYKNLSKNKNYDIYSRLVELEIPEAAEDFLNALSPQEKADMYLTFSMPTIVVDGEVLKTKNVIQILFRRTFNDMTFILESLAQTIQEMEDKGIEEVVLYGG
jgi:hypothetical protein